MTPTEPSIKATSTAPLSPSSAAADIPPPPNSRSTLPKEYDFFKVVQDYLDRAAKVINLESYVKTILSQPKNEIIINFPVRMDNGEVRLFKGYRCSTTTSSAHSRGACASTRTSPSTT